MPARDPELRRSSADDLGGQIQEMGSSGTDVPLLVDRGPERDAAGSNCVGVGFVLS